jgi:hypothetical protein
VLGVPASARAELQLRPFLGLAFGTSTTFTPDPAGGDKSPKLVYGVSGGLVGEFVGVEADFARWSGFLTPNESIITGSTVTTLMGNLVVALPRRLAEYTLRPYFGGGAGLVRVSVELPLAGLNYSRNMTGIDLGGGVTGFLTRRIGVSWDVRHFRARRPDAVVGDSFGAERISFWRANMALAIRY